MNRIIDVYALGVPPLYKAIDSISYDPKSDLYARLIDLITSVIQERRTELTMFYEPTLSFTRRLLDVNQRDEAARFELCTWARTPALFGGFKTSTGAASSTLPSWFPARDLIDRMCRSIRGPRCGSSSR